ncbi:MAG TPA: PAS domain S-box protein [Chloroflexota bacterium]|nr:PAS domain S-box protein [Chloroflexota bacterium]
MTAVLPRPFAPGPPPRPSDLGLGWLFVHVPDAAVVIDIGEEPAGRIVLWNRAASAILGFEESEALGRSFEPLVPDRLHSAYRTQVARCRLVEPGMETPCPAPVEMAVRRADGTELPAEVVFAPIKPNSADVGPGPFMLALIRDITHRKALEARLLGDAVREERDRRRAVEAQLDGIRLAAREIADRVGNALVTPHIVLDVLAEDPRAAEALAMLPRAKQGLKQAMGYLGKLQRVQRIATRETPVGPALDLDRSSDGAD